MPSEPFGIDLENGYLENDTVENFTQLQSLKLTRCSTTRFNLQRLAELKNLRWLDLNNSGNVTPSSLSRISQLESLFMTGALYQDHTFAALSELKHLRNLAFTANVYFDYGSGLQGLDQLQSLYLQGTDFEAWTGWGDETPFKNLQSLYLIDTGVRGQMYLELAKLQNLRTLHFTSPFEKSTHLTTSVSQLKQLQVLDIRGNNNELDQLSSIAQLQRIAQLQELKELNLLDWPFLKDIELKELSSLKKLQSLSVGYHFTGSGLEHLTALPELRNLTVQLYSPHMIEAELANLAKLVQLHNLKLIGANVSDATLAHLVGPRQLSTLSLTSDGG